MKKLLSKKALTKVQAIIIVVVIAVVAIVGAYAYLATRPPALEGEVIKVGAPIPITGAHSMQGEDIKGGMDIALEEINEEGVLGAEMQVIFEDTESKPSSSVSATEKLITLDNVDFIVGEYASATSIAMLETVRSYEQLTVLFGGSITEIRDEYFDPAPDYLWHLHPWADWYSVDTIGLISDIKEAGHDLDTAYILYETGPWGVSMHTMLATYFPDAGISYQAEPFEPGTTDFTPMLTKIKAANPDVFGMMGFPGDIVMVVRQAKELDFAPPVFWCGTGVDKAFAAETLGADALYLLGSTCWFSTIPYTGSADFVAEFHERFQRDPAYHAAYGYINLKIVAEAIKKAGSLEEDKIIEALGELEYDSIVGNIRFDSTTHSVILVDEDRYYNPVVQTQPGSQPYYSDVCKGVILYPQDAKTGDAVFPFPPWDER